MGVVGGALFHGQSFMALATALATFKSRSLALVDGFPQGLVHVFGQPFLHDVIVKHRAAKELGDTFAGFRTTHNHNHTFREIRRRLSYLPLGHPVTRKALRGLPSAPLLVYPYSIPGAPHLSIGFSPTPPFLQGEQKPAAQPRGILWKIPESLGTYAGEADVTCKTALTFPPGIVYSSQEQTRASGVFQKLERPGAFSGKCRKCGVLLHPPGEARPPGSGGLLGKRGKNLPTRGGALCKVEN